MTAPAFRRLKRPMRFLQGTAVVLVEGAEKYSSYGDAPLITDREALHVGDEVYVMGLMGEIRRAKVDSLSGDTGRASDEGMILLLKFGNDATKSWRCSALIDRALWESGALL